MMPEIQSNQKESQYKLEIKEGVVLNFEEKSIVNEINILLNKNKKDDEMVYLLQRFNFYDRVQDWKKLLDDKVSFKEIKNETDQKELEQELINYRIQDIKDMWGIQGLGETTMGDGGYKWMLKFPLGGERMNAAFDKVGYNAKQSDKSIQISLKDGENEGIQLGIFNNSIENMQEKIKIAQFNINLYVQELLECTIGLQNIDINSLKIQTKSLYEINTLDDSNKYKGNERFENYLKCKFRIENISFDLK